MRANLGDPRRRALLRGAVILASGLMLWAATGMAAFADSPNKIFQATVTTNGSMVAGGTYSLSSGPYSPVQITFVNNYASAAIQAVQLTVPTGITVLGIPTADWTTSAGTPGHETPTIFTTGYRVMEFDNVYITATTPLTVTIQAVAECFPTTGYVYDWNARAKQSNSFNGDPGNDFNELQPTTSTISGTCSLNFDAQPRDAERNANITSKPLDPTPPGVQVGIYDGSGTAHVTWWESNISLTSLNPATTTTLGGYTSAPAGSNGVAEFIHNTGTVSSPVWAGPTLATSAAGYTLRATTSLPSTTAFSYTQLGSITTHAATATGLGTDSASFVVVDDGMICTQGNSCFSQSSLGNLNAVVNSTTGDAGELVVSIAPAGVAAFDCAGYTASTATVDFNVTATNRSKTVTVTIFGGLKLQSANKWQACYRAPYVFTQRDGTSTTLVNGYSVGLLPDCSTKGPVVPPCILQRLPNPTTKDMGFVITTPPGDPGVKF